MYKNRAIINYILFCLVCILVILNSTRYFVRLDVTKNKIYSISNTTKKILDKLDNKISITYFVSQSLKNKEIRVQALSDILYEYANASNMIEYQEVFITDSNKDDYNLDKIGIKASMYKKASNTELTSSIVYSGISIKYLDKQKVIPFIADDASLEFILTSAIKNISTKKQSVLGILVGSPTINQNSLSYLSKIFEATEVRFLDPNKKLDSDIDVLFVIGFSKLSKDRLIEIDQYTMSGKSAVFFVDRINVPIQGPNSLKGASDKESAEYLKFLSSYGVNIKNALILDEFSKTVPFNQNGSIISKKYPFWIELLPPFMKKGSPLLKNIKKVDLYWASPIEYDKKNANIQTLITSSPKSWLQEKDYYLNPNQDMYFNLGKEDTKDKYPVLVRIGGKLNAYFKNDPKSIKKQTLHANVLVLSDTGVIDFQMMQMSQQGLYYNIPFIQNLYIYLSPNKELLNIKTKDSRFNTLDKITDLTLREEVIFFVKILNVIIFPFLVICIGLFKILYLNKIQRRI